MLSFWERKDKEKGLLRQRSSKTKEEIFYYKFCDF